MSKICRTCTHAITTNEYFCLDGSSYVSSALLIKHLLQSCVPEFDLELVPESAICRNCMSALHIAYCFKQETIKNEETFWSKQRIRVKNFDALTKSSISELDALDVSDDCGVRKVEAFELELADPNDLKVEFVYDDDEDPNEVEIVTEGVLQPFTELNENLVADKSVEELSQDKECTPYDDNIKAMECPPLVPYDDRLQLLETFSCDVDLQVDNESFQISDEADDDFEMPLEDTDEGSFFEQKDIDDKNELSLKDVLGNVKDEESKTDETSVTSYIQRTSGASRKTRNVDRPYKCSECNFRSDAKGSLIMHRRIHTGEKPYHCTICAYKAKRKAHLEDHMKIHTGERPYRCHFCEKCFITKQIMKKHARIHTGETPYECMQCNYRARHKLSIANHVRKVHIGVTKVEHAQPSVCYICGKCLAGPASLSTHMRIHTGVKSHLCELCGRYFREKGMLNNHLRTHTGEKPFKCTQCDYIATRKAHLRDHMRTHIGRIELVQCTECGKRYATKFLLRKHMKEEHATEQPLDLQQFVPQF